MQESFLQKALKLQYREHHNKTQNFSWNLGANYTQYVSTVDELAPGVTNIFLGGFVNLIFA
jgi:hypothetical protein